MLAANPAIRSFPETHFFNRLIDFEAARSFDYGPAGILGKLDRFKTKIRIALGVAPRMRTKRYAWDILMKLPGWEAISPPYRSFTVRPHVKTYIHYLDWFSLKDGKAMWVEKTPGHLHFIREIQKHVQGAQFIHILRRGPDNIASLFDAAQRYPNEHWATYGSIERAIRRWNIALRDSLKYRGNPNHYFVRYEELVNEPEEVLQGVCRFLGCEYDEQMISGHSKAAEGLVQSDEPWKAGNFGTIRATSDTKFFELFDEKQQQYIQDNISEWRE
jgi:hypothetical protein